MRVFEYSSCCHFFFILSFGRHATMTSPMNLIAAASLLLSAANHNPAASAFRSPAAAAAASSSSLIRRRRPEHAIVGGPSRPTPSVPLASSPYDDDDYDDDDTEGYEIRDGGGRNSNKNNNNNNNNNGNRRSPLRPETTFGAENVPVDFRPSNEYLNLVRQPTFGWASQECGDSGLAIRLAIVYAGFFFLV
jgi:hypothetical protein